MSRSRATSVMRRTWALVFMLAAAACSDVNSTTAPSRRPAPLPTTSSLSGQVVDSATGRGIPGATVSIAAGPNGGRSTTTDATGSYSLAGIQPPPYGLGEITNVTVSATSYAPQTKEVTFTSTPSDQSLSFKLVRANGTISFSGLAAMVGSAFTTYTESGFTVSATAGSWTVDGYGNPGPSVIFSVADGSTVTGRMQVTAGGATFGFTSIDLYSSTTPIPYTITGLRNAATMFTMAATLPNTFGNFVTVVNPQAAAVIDTLVVNLTDTAAACCSNPMGVDNIAVSK
jgi:hypothetical protein